MHELRELSLWSEGQVWCSPERHGQVTGILKAQIDHLPLAIGGRRPTQGRTLAVMQVSAGSQSFNTINTLRVLGRWMRMVTIPNQSSIAKAYLEFDENGRMKPSSYYDRIVDVMEELVRFTVLLRPHAEQLVDRYSERKDQDQPVATHVGSGCFTRLPSNGPMDRATIEQECTLTCWWMACAHFCRHHHRQQRM